MKNGSIHLKDEAATLRAGKALAAAIVEPILITLSGDLGAGKTTLSRGLITALGHHGAVKSPTFTLVETYEIGSLAVAHFDLYRLADPEELEFIGIRDYLDGSMLCLVEWPDRGKPMLPDADLALEMLVTGRTRELLWRAGSEKGRALAVALDLLSTA